MDPKKAIGLARIHSLKDTWTDQDAVADAKHRLQAAFDEKPQTTKSHEFEFVIDDQNTYYQQSDFKSPQVKKLFGKYLQLERLSKSSKTNWKSNVPCTPVPRKAIKPNWLPPYSTWKSRYNNYQVNWRKPPLKCVIQKNNPLNRKLWTYLSSLYSLLRQLSCSW